MYCIYPPGPPPPSATGLLSTQQSGNRRFHSTETSLIETTDSILNAIDGKELTAVVLLDMSKAFDSIDHNILLLKLQDVGVSPAALNWFTSYLSERFQVVRINTIRQTICAQWCPTRQHSWTDPL